MRNFPKSTSLSRVGLLCAVLGFSAATQAQAIGIDMRPPPNGANGISLNGLTSNGLAANGLTSNGLTSNGLTSNGLAANGLTSNGLTSNGLTSNGRDSTGGMSQDLVPYAVTLPSGERVALH